MTDDANKSWTIEQYLLGELSGKLLEDFEQNLALDDNLRREVALERAIIRNLKTVGREDRRRKLDRFHQEMNPGVMWEGYQEWAERQPVSTRKKRLLIGSAYGWLVAAGVALILACALLFPSIWRSSFSPESVFAEYYDPYPAPGEFRGSATVSSLQQEGFAAYNQKDFPKCIELFNRILAAQKNEIVLFYLGNAYLSAGRTQDAIQTFQTYLQMYNGFEVEAKWYLSLGYLKAGKDEEALKLLEEFSTATGGPALEYQEEATRILSAYQ